MALRVSDFSDFLEVMRGKRLLHIGHREADCDALGSAYALNRLLPGELGFARGLKNSAYDLADWLGITILDDPVPQDFDYTIIYDTRHSSLLGIDLPARYALFDHHEPGGHRYARFHNELAEGAEWAWVEPMDSTCSLLIDLFQQHSIPIDEKMAVALAAGIITDTVWLQQANSRALERLSSVLSIGALYVEDVLAIIDGPERKSARRSSVMEALCKAKEHYFNGWSILTAEAENHDHGFAIIDSLKHMGADVSLVNFPKDDLEMVMAECSTAVADGAGLDLVQIMREIAPQVQAFDFWGTRTLGRIMAPVQAWKLRQVCVERIAQVLSAPDHPPAEMSDHPSRD